jgi:hypothetical protein
VQELIDEELKASNVSPDALLENVPTLLNENELNSIIQNIETVRQHFLFLLF